MAEQTSPKKTTTTGKGLSAKWHGIPVPILLVGAGVGLYFAYRWYQSRNTSSTSAVSSTAPPSSSSPSSGSGYSGTGASGGGAPGSGGYVPPWAPLTPSGAAVDPFLRPTTGQKTVPGPGASYPGPPPSTTPAPSTPAPTPAGTKKSIPLHLAAAQGGISQGSSLVPGLNPAWIESHSPANQPHVAPIAARVHPNFFSPIPGYGQSTSYTPAKHFNPSVARSGQYYYKSGGTYHQYQPGKSRLASGTQLFTA